MKLSRPHLTVLLNALYDTETTTIPVTHPSDAIGELFRINLGDPDDTRIDITTDTEAYADAVREVERIHGSPADDELPAPRSYTNAFLAGGLLAPANQSDIVEFLDRNGYPDLTAGHQPVVAGFDTNLLPWRIADVLDLEPGQESAINGFVVPTGVRDELDWDYKRSNTEPLEAAFGDAFEAFWNQPAGANREGRLGETYYRRLRDHQYADEVVSDTGDDQIIEALGQFQTDSRKTVLLFSNDRNFIERARAHRIRAQRIEFPAQLPSTIHGSWPEIRNTLYVLTILFGVLELPKVTLYGIWRGKGGQAWHEEQIHCDCRSPKVEPLLERDLSIIDAYESITH